ncbi:MAG: OST-HTH/LOTUS domain-containing protein, partial [Deltaproteobacteria bacterium]
LKGDTKLVNLLRSAVEAASDDSGWAHLSAVGNNIAKQTPEFDPRNYGFSKLGELTKATNLFNVDGRVSRDGHSKTIYIRDKRNNPKK